MRRRTWIAVAAAASLVIAGTAVIVAVAATPTPTTTLVVHLVDPRGRPITSFDRSLRVELQGITTAGRFGVSRYAAASKQFCYKHRCAPGWVGSIRGGVATFRGLPAGQKFDIDVSAGHAFLYSSHVGYVVPHLTTRSVNFTLTEGASISGTVRTVAGEPIKGIVVAAVDATGHIVHRANTGADGGYRVVGLPTGEYRVLFNAKPFGDTVPDFAYTPEYFRTAEITKPSDVPGFASATSIVLNQASRSHGGADSDTGDDGALAVGPTSTIRITLPAGPVPDATVLYVSDGHAADARSIVANSGGTVTLRLTPGRYFLRTSVPASASGDEGDDVALWFAGAGRILVKSKAASAPLVVGSTGDSAVDFGPRR